MPSKSTKLDNRDVNTDGHNIGYYRSSFTGRDPRNRRGGGAKTVGEIPVTEKIPAGTLVLFVGDSNPDTNNYSIADGSAVSRSTYADLFSVITTDYGSGDGSNTFNLPDLTGHQIRHTSSTPGIDSAIAASTHNHGGLTVASGVYSSGNTADASNNVQNAVNNAITSTAGNINGHKMRDHGVLPLISLKECELVVGTLLYTFRDLSKSRTFNTVLSANGAAYAAGTYGDLYTVTGTDYGGSSANPNTPDYRGCFPKCVKTYSKANNYVVDEFPQHHHGPWTAVYTGGSNQSTRQDGSAGAGGVTSNGTTSSAGIGNANEMRGTNFAAHPIIVADNSLTNVKGLGNVATNSLEPGDIIFYLGSTAPSSKYKLLNGGAAVSKTTYTILGDKLEANFISGDNIDILDLRDRYVRGVDAGSSRDPNASARTFGGTGSTNGANATGTFQAQALTGHTHTFYQGVNNAGQNQYPGYNDATYRAYNISNVNSYGIVYNTNVTTNSNSDIRVPDIKVNMCMLLEI